MNNAEIIRGIDLTLEGLKTIREALTNEEVAPKTTLVQDVEEAPVLEGSLEVDVEELKAMKYNEFKKFASSLGVKCTGTRDEILARILALDNAVIVSAPVPVKEEESEDEAPVEEVKHSNVKKFEKKESKVEEPERDEFDEQAEALAEETPIEDIIEALADVDIKATKKNAVSLLAKALREGLIEIEEDQEDYTEYEAKEEPEEVEEEDSEEQDINVNSYFSQFDPEGYNDPEGMTEERAKAVKAKMHEILTAFYEDGLTEDDITSYIEDNATEEEIELLGDGYTSDDILMFYMELIKRTIDNDGEEHEPADPYELGNNDMCCGHELKYIKKTKKYVCEHCGTEYEAE